MSMIKVDKLTFAYPTSYDNIFENVSFQIDTDWRLGFVGRNGRGKTTFLQLLLGKYEYSGHISAAVTFDYFPFEVPDKSLLTLDILQELCPQAAEWEIIRELSYLKLGDEVLWRPFNTLSNGEQTKTLLAALFLKPGKFLLLDEPTNHLDAPARELVSAYLRRKKGFILVSHDRRFLDNCVDHILAINRTNIEVQNSNFSCWLAEFEQRQQSEQERQQLLHRDIKRLRQAARRTAEWSDKVEASKQGAYDKGYVGHKSAKMMQRAKNLAARQQQAIEEKTGLLQNQENAEPLKLWPLRHHAEVLADFAEVGVAYAGLAGCQPVSFSVRQGERVVLAGANGSGKSSLLKLLLGEELPQAEIKGQLRTASGLVISYVPQDTSFLRGSLRGFAAEQGIDETLFLAILRKLDFARVQFEKDLAELSAGQRKKVLLAKSLCEQAHIYVWDEPLNYVDIFSRLQLEQLIVDFAPTMLLVEHDLAFQEKVATRFVHLERLDS